MKIKRILSFVCVLAMIVIMLLTTSSAEDSVGSVSYYTQNWQGVQWMCTNMVSDSSGTVTPMSYINEEGNLELRSFNNTSHKRIYAQYPYSVNENGTLNGFPTGNELLFVNNANFDIDFRMRYDGSVTFMNQWYHGGVRLAFADNRITYDDGSGDYKSVKITDDGKWHNYTVKVRGNSCNGKASNGPDCIRYARVYMDGRELFGFHISRRPHAYRNYRFYVDNDYDRASWAEVEYVNITDKSSNVKFTSHKAGDTVEAGQDLVMTVDAGVENKTVDFYMGNLKIGSVTDKGKTDASITIPALQAGTYTFKAVCDGVESADIVIFSKTTLSATVIAPVEVSDGDEINLSVNTVGTPKAVKAEYYLNNVKVAESSSGDSFAVKVSETLSGTASVYAKVYTADGTTVMSDIKKIKINATDAKNAKFNREYKLDYTVAENGKVDVKDGYFRLTLQHSGKAVSYNDTNGTSKVYSGSLGAGSYRVVVTAGNAEVYYNGQFAFSFLMPNCYDSQSISYEGVENVSVGSSGVKITYFHHDWNGEKEISEFPGECGRYYSIEFDKKDTSRDSIIANDGFYEVIVDMDDTGIWVNRQPTVAAPTEKYKVADNFTDGYYRITVAEGMAQIFCNNRIVGTWRCPLVSSRPSVVRDVENPAATTFLALKGIDDVYYHNEDFEGNIEEGFKADDYWYDETDGRIETDEIEALYKHEIATVDGNSFLKMTGEGTYFLNAFTYDGSLKWRGYFDGTDGMFGIRFREAMKNDFCRISYDPSVSLWSMENSKKTLTTDYDTEDSDGDGDTTEALRTYYAPVFTNIATAEKTLSAGWHDFELILNGGTATLYCDGNAVISGSGLRNSYGKFGFEIKGSGSLGVDNVEYAGEGKVTAGYSYINDGRTEFYKNFKGQVIAADAGSGMTWYSSEDNGETWTEVKGKAGEWLGSRGSNNIMLLSGKFLRVRYAGAYDYAYLYDETSYVNRNATANGTEYTPANSQGVCMQAAGTMDGIPHSGMPSRLMQIQSGPYKGRVIYCRGGSGEIYGRTYMYWTDDYDGVNDPPSTQAVWHPATVQLTYFNTGINIQESQMVDMPDGTLRYYVRTEMGHLAYFTSSDGGESWDSITEMKTENLIAPMCCYSIQRKGDTNTYYSFWEYDLTTANLTYLESPRNRRALAVSYDGMETWEYVADIEEEGRTASCTSSACNHGMRYVDGAVYMGYYHGYDYHKMFRVDETKIKTLKRFTAPHYRSQMFSSVRDFNDQNCVIPKTTGDAFVYGNYIHTDVNSNGLAKADVVAKAVGAVYSQNAVNATLTFGDATITLTNGLKGYAINGVSAETDTVCYETGYLHPGIIGKIFGKAVSESDVAYVISNEPMVDNHTNQIQNMGICMTSTEAKSVALLGEINVASSANDSEGIYVAMQRYTDVLGFTPSVNDDEVYARMTGITYKTVADIEKVFEKALDAQKRSENSETAIALSTVSGGFEGWTVLGINKGNISVSEGVATLEIDGSGNAEMIYGTPGLDIPKAGFNFTYDFSLDNTDNVMFKIGTGESLAKIEVLSDRVLVYSENNTASTSKKIDTDKWYTVRGTVLANDDGKFITCEITDGTEIIKLCENLRLPENEALKGFWVINDGETDAEINIKNVRVYKGKAIDVIAYTAKDGNATATVDLLNDGTEIKGSKASDTNATLTDQNFDGEVDFTDGKNFSRSTTLTENYTVDTVDGAMYFYKSLDGFAPIEQRILLPYYNVGAPADDIEFEYDLMIPDDDMWNQREGEANAFMYFDIYINHPVKPLRQTMYIEKNRMKVGSMPYYFKDICGSDDYDGVWMSFKHRYYFEDGEWKCDFVYKKRSDTQWTVGYGGAMNSSTNRNNYVRFYAYPEDQIEICVDNVKVRNVGKDEISGQLIMGIYEDERQLAVQGAEQVYETLPAYGARRYIFENLTYNAENSDEIAAKFFIWSNYDEKTPIGETTSVR